MPLKLVPVPYISLAQTHQAWAPFVIIQAQKQNVPVEQLLGDVFAGNISLILAWNEEEKKAHALAGIRFIKAGDHLVARIEWLVGFRRQEWIPLNDMLEEQLRGMNCRKIYTKARLGWKLELKKRGYRMTHIEWEKDL